MQCQNPSCSWHARFDELVLLHAGYLRTLLAVIASSIGALAGLFAFINIMSMLLSNWHVLYLKIYGAVVFFCIWLCVAFFVSLSFILYKQIVSIEQALGWSDFIEHLFVTRNKGSLILNRVANSTVTVLRRKENTDRFSLVVLTGLISLLAVGEIFLLAS